MSTSKSCISSQKERSLEMDSWVCVHCGHPLDRVYTLYSKGNIQLESCPQCHHFADPYLECDPLLIFVDMLLQKRGAYRHVLYNLRSTKTSRIVPKLGICLFLFEVYLRLLRMSKSQVPLHSLATAWSTFQLKAIPEHKDVVHFFVAEWLPLPLQTVSLVMSEYFIVLFSTLFEFGVMYMSVRIYFRYFLTSPSSSKSKILQALFLSSFGRLLLFLVVIWEPQKLNPEHINYVWIINGYVLLSNTEALCAIQRDAYWKVLILLIVSQVIAHLLIHYVIQLLLPL